MAAPAAAAHQETQARACFDGSMLDATAMPL